MLFIFDGGKLAHRLCVLPAHFCFPFMGRNDLQISSTWTEPAYRPKGVATFALKKVMLLMNEGGRRFWYIARSKNAASIAVCRKAGFSLVGYARRTRRMGSWLLGQYIIEERGARVRVVLP